MKSATTTETASLRLSPTTASRGDRRSDATLGSASTPIPTEQMVMPSCTPDRWNDSCFSVLETIAARRSPLVAATSTSDRSTATRENSTATKKAVAATSNITAAKPM